VREIAVIFMTELLDGLALFLLPFLPSIAAFVLVTFSPLRRVHQPAKFFVTGFASGVIAALLSAVAMARGIFSSQASVFIVAMSTVVGAAISLLTSSESISEKKRDELVRKSDDQSWRV
jgi:hypothetical protein